jgi:SET domain-containing protein
MRLSLAKPPAIDPRFACFRLRMGRSAIQGRGVYACQVIPPRRKVIEYTGEIINLPETIRRFHGPNHQYIFLVNRRWSIDARLAGSGAELVNHGCDPNLFSTRRKGHVILMSRRRIEPGEELTYDYHYSPTAPRVPCRCGSPRCRGTINLKAPRSSGRSRRRP